MLNMFLDPLGYAFDIGENLMLNGANILNDMWGAVQSYENGDYYNLGVNVGKALALTTLG